MTTIEEFLIKFKTDASGTVSDIKKLDDVISKLAEKGQKRTEIENKQLKELRQLKSQTTQDIKDQTKATDSLADSLLNMGLTAITAFAGFEAIKKVATNAYDLNLSLQKTRILTGQNAEEIQAWDQAFTALGVNQGEFTSWFTNLSQVFQATGRDTKQIIPDLKALSDVMRGLEAQGRDSEARAAFQNAVRAYGLPQDFLIPLLEGGDALERLVGIQREFIKASPATEEAARKLSASFGNLASSFTGFLTKILNLGGFQTGWNNFLATLFSGNFDKGKLILALGSGLPISSNPTIPSSEGAVPGIKTNSSQVLPLISKYESSNRNVLNASGPGGTPASTASGYYQITNGTWRDFAPKVGVSLDQYPTAISAPGDVQAKVASAIYDERGLEPWSTDNRLLLAAVGQSKLSQANQSPFNSTIGGTGSQSSLSIGTLNVQTQAKDAPGIADAIADELSRAYRSVVSNWDDGRAK